MGIEGGVEVLVAVLVAVSVAVSVTMPVATFLQKSAFAFGLLQVQVRALLFCNTPNSCDMLADCFFLFLVLIRSSTVRCWEGEEPGG